MDLKCRNQSQQTQRGSNEDSLFIYRKLKHCHYHQGNMKDNISVLQRLCYGLIWCVCMLESECVCHNCTVSFPGKPLHFTGNQSSAPMMTLLSLCTNRPATRCASEAHIDANTHTNTQLEETGDSGLNKWKKRQEIVLSLH